MPRNVEIAPGYVVEFPDSMSEAQVSSASARLFSQHKAATPQAGSAPAPSGMSDEQWATLTPQEKMRNVLQWGGKAIASMTGMGGAGNEAVENPTTTLALAALPGGGKAANAAIPSKVRAGANFQNVMAAAKDVPVDVDAPGRVALRIADLAQRGGGTNFGPGPVRQFIQYITDPKKPEMTYEVARDFASNISRLSAKDLASIPGPMKREIGNLRVALNGSVARAAAAAGKGEEYASAMREYARRSNIDDMASDVWSGVKRSWPYATATGLGYAGARKAMELLGSGQ